MWSKKSAMATTIGGIIRKNHTDSYEDGCGGKTVEAGNDGRVAKIGAPGNEGYQLAPPNRSKQTQKKREEEGKGSGGPIQG